MRPGPLSSSCHQPLEIGAVGSLPRAWADALAYHCLLQAADQRFQGLKHQLPGIVLPGNRRLIRPGPGGNHHRIKERTAFGQNRCCSGRTGGAAQRSPPAATTTPPRGICVNSWQTSTVLVGFWRFLLKAPSMGNTHGHRARTRSWPAFRGCAMPGSNQRHPACKAGALPLS